MSTTPKIILEKKLAFQDVITTILQLSDGSLNYELLSYFDFLDNTPITSSFIQQHSNILPIRL